MRIVLLQHLIYDDTLFFVTWMKRNGHMYEILRPAEPDVIYPNVEDVDMLIVLGGAMGVYQEDEYPWLVGEKGFLRQALKAEKLVFGVCLGAQMIADVMGVAVKRHLHKEIGWHSIERTGEHPLLAGLPQHFHSFQWHGDTFAIPEEAIPLARSAACSHQAYAIGDRILGLQFHLETSPACLEQMVTDWASELVDAPFIQRAEQMKEEAYRAVASERMLHGILDQYAKVFISIE